jgi:hypothetical protein
MTGGLSTAPEPQGRRGPREAAGHAAVNGMRVMRGSGTGTRPGIMEGVTNIMMEP